MDFFLFYCLWTRQFIAQPFTTNKGMFQKWGGLFWSFSRPFAWRQKQRDFQFQTCDFFPDKNLPHFYVTLNTELAFTLIAHRMLVPEKIRTELLLAGFSKTRFWQFGPQTNIRESSPDAGFFKFAFTTCLFPQMGLFILFSIHFRIGTAEVKVTLYFHLLRRHENSRYNGEK